MGKARRVVTAKKKKRLPASTEAVRSGQALLSISIFTPTHTAAFLAEVYESIKGQDFYEWIVLLNGGAKYANPDPRVKIYIDTTGVDYVGYLKARCCELATGDVLLELDHDDLLAPNCVEEVRKAFADPKIGFVYSNAVQSAGDFKPAQRFNEGNGWRYRPANWQGHPLDEVVSFEATPAALSRIWYAPNHLRAFRRDAYLAVGGYSRKMRVLDDQDLMCRLYGVTEFHHIDKGLYLYRITGENCWLKHNQEIQNNVWRLHDQYIQPLAARWAELNGLRKLDLGGRIDPADGFETVDLKNANFCCDLNEPWPFEDDSVGVVRAFDVFEHLRDSVHTMFELYRVLAPGGYAFIQVPSTEGFNPTTKVVEPSRGAFQDPTHVSFWNQNSFLYYSDERWAKYIGTPVRFQAMRCFTTNLNADRVSWVRADLLKLTKGQRVPGQVLI